jgi:hypothetical protein
LGAQPGWVAWMPASHNRLAPFAIALLVGCASAPSPAPAPVLANVYARIPSELAGFKLTERSTVRGMPSDSLFRFRDTTQVRLTVIVYNVPADARDANLDLSTMREGENFRTVQAAQKARGVISDYTEPVSDTTRIPAGKGRIFVHFVVVPTRWPNATVTVETQHLYVIAGKFVKVRATIPHSLWPNSRTTEFARALAVKLSS